MYAPLLKPVTNTRRASMHERVVRDEEDRIEERDVAVARGRRVEVPGASDRLGVDEDRVAAGDLLEIRLRTRAGRAAAAAVQDEHERVGDLRRVPFGDDEREGAVASRGRSRAAPERHARGRLSAAGRAGTSRPPLARACPAGAVPAASPPRSGRTRAARSRAASRRARRARRRAATAQPRHAGHVTSRARGAVRHRTRPCGRSPRRRRRRSARRRGADRGSRRTGRRCRDARRRSGGRFARPCAGRTARRSGGRARACAASPSRGRWPSACFQRSVPSAPSTPTSSPAGRVADEQIVDREPRGADGRDGRLGVEERRAGLAVERREPKPAPIAHGDGDATRP